MTEIKIGLILCAFGVFLYVSKVKMVEQERKIQDRVERIDSLFNRLDSLGVKGVRVDTLTKERYVWDKRSGAWLKIPF